MKFISHLKLAVRAGSLIWQGGMISFLAYIFGSVQPDIKVTSYFLGTEPGDEGRGHSYQTAIRRMGEIEALIAMDPFSRIANSYRYGKLSHYAADAFTHAHNTDLFSGGIKEHREYEFLLDAALSLRLLTLRQTASWVCSTENLKRIHEQYTRREPSPENDLDSIIPAVLSIAFQANIQAAESRAARAFRRAV